MDIATQISTKQKLYNIYIENAITDRVENDGEYSVAGVGYLREAAYAQAELAKLTTGSARTLHKETSISLLKEIYEASKRLGLTENVEQMDSFNENAAKAKPAAQQQPQSQPQSTAKPGEANTEKVNAGSGKKDSEVVDFDPHSTILPPCEVTFNDVVGKEKEIHQIKRKIDSLTSESKFSNVHTKVRAPLHQLFYGPPGTGKTFLCKAISSYVYERYGDRGAFFNVSCKELSSKYVGVAEKKIGMLFDAVKEYDFAVICLDEIQHIASNRENENKGGNYTDPLLQAIDGVGGKTTAMIIGCTNYPWMVDDALLNRLTNLVFLDYPGVEEVQQFLLNFLEGEGTLGEDEETQKKLSAIAAQIAVDRHFSYRNMDVAVWRLHERAMDKTEEKYPDGNDEIKMYIPLTEAEIRQIMNAINVPFSQAQYDRYLAYNKNATGPR